jgi:sugar lactone lactonase YvrE
MSIDASGNYWIGTRRYGLVIFNPITKKTRALYTDIREANIIHALQFDKRNNCMWIGTHNTGLHQYNFSDNSLTHVQRNDKDPEAMHSSLINDITISGNYLWVATVESGLARVSKNGEKYHVKNYTQKDGLLDLNILSVSVANDGKVYFGTSKGLGVIAQDGDLNPFLTTAAGLPFSEFKQSLYPAPSGEVATVINNELFCFNPSVLVREKKTNLIISEALLNDSIPIYNTPLNFKQNNISFQFVYLDFVAPQSIEYYYTLQGFDKEWINNKNNHFIKYTNLPPGNYIFKVKVKRPSGEFSNEVAEWKLTILPPFWQRWWFITIVTIALSFLIFLILKQRIKAVRKQEKLKRDYEKRLAETEMQALRAQMNPHFMFNSLNSINNFILKNDADNASGYLTKFSRLMRLILDNSRSEWVLLENELKALELYIELEAVRFDNTFSHHVEVTKDISIETVMIPPLLIQPYVENAIWHGLLHRNQSGGKLDIRLWKNDNRLYIEIEDNGVGRDEAKRLKSKTAIKQKSHGMKITAERMDIVNKVYNVNAGVTITDIKDEMTKQAGTRVLITLKYKTHDSNNS